MSYESLASLAKGLGHLGDHLGLGHGLGPLCVAAVRGASSAGSAGSRGSTGTWSSGSSDGWSSRTSSESSRSSGSDGSREHDHQCSNCDGVGLLAVPGWRCTACFELLCDKCALSHQLSRATGDHLLVALDTTGNFSMPPPPPLWIAQAPIALPTPTPTLAAQPRAASVASAASRASPTCEEHPGEPLSLYCDRCSSPCCGVCVRRTHLGHRIAQIRSAIERSKGENAEFLEDATKGATAVWERLTQTEKMVEMVETKAAKVVSEIREGTRRVVVAVQDRERELLAQVEKIRELKARSLAVQVEALRGLLQRYSRLSESLRDAMQRGERGHGVELLHAKEKAVVELAQLRASASARSVLAVPGHPLPFEDDALLFTPPEPLLLRAVSNMGAVSSSAYALTTVAAGEGLSAAIKGRPAVFTVQVRNHLDETVTGTSALGLEAVLFSTDGGVVHADVEDRRDGSFLVVYRPRALGPHALHVTLRGRHIKDSPFQVAVRGLRSYDDMRHVATSFGVEGSDDGDFLRPWGVACDRQGRLIVADRSNNRVQVFSAAGQFIFKFGSHGSGRGQFDRPAGVASDLRGRIVVADKDNHRVQVFSAAGEFLLSFGELGCREGQFNYPWDVDTNAQGQIVVSDTRNHRIQLFSPDGQFLTKYGWEMSASMWRHFDTPRGVSFHPEGFVIVTDFNNHRLVVVEPSFRNARFLGGEGSGAKQFLRPQGVAVDGEGNIIVADSRNNRLQVFRSNGVFVAQIGAPDVAMDRPSGVCVTPLGLAVVDFGHNRLLVLNS